MILGSTVIGWLPAFTYFALICKDCLFSELWMMGNMTEVIILIIVNFLMIGKTATNSYIYACRMKEIKFAPVQTQSNVDALLARLGTCHGTRTGLGHLWTRPFQF
ncbi:hypothetical protein J6590_056056 [Homalodisca vitripennis]|nr:hypothetical protein J6590_056056 [Homalodisca vitripennis]